MSKAVKCPICGGSGEYTPSNDGWSTLAPMPRTCHGCGGPGWVEVDSLENIIPPIKTKNMNEQPWDTTIPVGRELNKLKL